MLVATYYFLLRAFCSQRKAKFVQLRDMCSQQGDNLQLRANYSQLKEIISSCERCQQSGVNPYVHARM